MRVNWGLACWIDVLPHEIKVMTPSRIEQSDGAIGDILHRRRFSGGKQISAGLARSLDIARLPASGAGTHPILKHAELAISGDRNDGVTAFISELGGFLGNVNVPHAWLPGVPRCGEGTTPPSSLGNGLSAAGLSAEKVDNHTAITQTGEQHGIPESGWVIAVATAMREPPSKSCRDADHDVVDLSQQCPSKGWGIHEQCRDPMLASEAF
jgi:hypothetical protein